MSVCGRKKVEPDDCEGDFPNSLSHSSSGSSDDNCTIEMEPHVENPIPEDDKPVTPVATEADKPVTPVAKPDSSATSPTPISGSKRVQTPVTPIRGAGPESNSSVISAKQSQMSGEPDSEDMV